MGNYIVKATWRSCRQMLPGMGGMRRRAVAAELTIRLSNKHLPCARHMLVPGDLMLKKRKSIPKVSNHGEGLSFSKLMGQGALWGRGEDREIVADKYQIMKDLDGCTKWFDNRRPLEEGGHVCL